MSTKKSTFEVLNSINVNEHVKQKMNLSYLSWPFAWSELQKAYPDSSYMFLPIVTYPDGSCEVSVQVTANNVTREMFLPVMDHRNNAIKSPNARQISDAKMRCFVKCIAMFGLGLYIYAGEDLPEAPKPPTKAELKKKWAKTNDALWQHFQNSDADGLHEVLNEVEQQEKGELWSLIPSEVKTFITNNKEAA